MPQESREFRSAQRKESEGIEIDETTWTAICQEGRTLGARSEQLVDIAHGPRPYLGRTNRSETSVKGSKQWNR